MDYYYERSMQGEELVKKFNLSIRDVFSISIFHEVDITREDIEATAKYMYDKGEIVKVDYDYIVGKSKQLAIEYISNKSYSPIWRIQDYILECVENNKH